jgi:hypothetical protein
MKTSFKAFHIPMTLSISFDAQFPTPKFILDAFEVSKLHIVMTICWAVTVPPETDMTNL